MATRSSRLGKLANALTDAGLINGVEQIEGLQEFLDLMNTNLQTALDGLSGGAVTRSISENLALSPNDARVQVITATVNNLKVGLPDATLMTLGGPKFIMRNAGSKPFRVRDFTGKVLFVLPPTLTVSISLEDDQSAGGIWNTTSEQPIGRKFKYNPVQVYTFDTGRALSYLIGDPVQAHTSQTQSSNQGYGSLLFNGIIPKLTFISEGSSSLNYYAPRDPQCPAGSENLSVYSVYYSSSYYTSFYRVTVNADGSISRTVVVNNASTTNIEYVADYRMPGEHAFKVWSPGAGQSNLTYWALPSGATGQAKPTSYTVNLPSNYDYTPGLGMPKGNDDILIFSGGKVTGGFLNPQLLRYTLPAGRNAIPTLTGTLNNVGTRNATTHGLGVYGKPFAFNNDRAIVITYDTDPATPNRFNLFFVNYASNANGVLTSGPIDLTPLGVIPPEWNGSGSKPPSGASYFEYWRLTPTKVLIFLSGYYYIATFSSDFTSLLDISDAGLIPPGDARSGHPLVRASTTNAEPAVISSLHRSAISIGGLNGPIFASMTEVYP